MANATTAILLLLIALLFLFSSFSVPEVNGRFGGGGRSDAAELLTRTRRLLPDEREEYYRTAASAGVRPVGGDWSAADAILGKSSAAQLAHAAVAAAEPAERAEPRAGAAKQPAATPNPAGGGVGSAAPSFDESGGCFGCNGGSRPQAVDPATGCNRERRPYHTLLTSSSGTYQLWQSRVMHHHFRMQQARDPCGEMGGFTRLLTSTRGSVDAFSAEMPTVVVDEIHRGYPVVNRPSSVVQFVEGGHLDKIEEE